MSVNTVSRFALFVALGVFVFACNASTANEGSGENSNHIEGTAYIDVISWEGGAYNGAWVVDNDTYREVGQSFIANTSGALVGISLNCSRLLNTSFIRIRVYEFDERTQKTTSTICSKIFDISSVKIDLINPDERFFHLCGRPIVAGTHYMFSIEILDGKAFYLQANVNNYAGGGIWFKSKGSDSWVSLGHDDSDFKVWLSSECSECWQCQYGRSDNWVSSGEFG